MTFMPGNRFPDGSVEVNPVLKCCIVFVLFLVVVLFLCVSHTKYVKLSNLNLDHE